MLVQENLKPRRLSQDELNNMPPFNRSVYNVINSFGSKLQTFATSNKMAEVISAETIVMGNSLGLANTQDLATKLNAIKGKLATQKETVTKEDLEEYLRNMLKKRIKESLREAGLDPELIEKMEDKEVLDADRKQDNEQNQDLFELVNNKNNIRLQDRQALERDLQDRQRSVAERSLRILEAMEKVKDAIVQGKENLELDLSCFRELGPEELSKQMSFLERFGLKQMDLENGEIVFSIPMRELHSESWRAKAEAYKAQFKERGIGKDRAENGVRIADDVPALRREQEQKQNETRADEEMVM